MNQDNMLRFRPKLGTERSSEWRCCFCLHVRTGTILLGSWHLILHLVALGFLAVVVRDPRLLDQLQRESAPIGSALPTPQANVEMPSSYTQATHHPRDQSLIYLCTLAITLMMVYGAARGKPAHVLPFFCLQIFDFAITVLTATGYLCYIRSIHILVRDAKHVPWREDLLRLPAPALALIILSAFLGAVVLKAYCISIVWRCYKYLTMRAHALENLTPFVISSEGMVTPSVSTYPPPAPDYSSLLPNYEEAVKQTPPPSYRAATLMANADPAVTTPATPPEPQNATAAAPAHTVVMLPQQGSQAGV